MILKELFGGEVVEVYDPNDETAMDQLTREMGFRADPRRVSIIVRVKSSGERCGCRACCEGRPHEQRYVLAQ